MTSSRSRLRNSRRAIHSWLAQSPGGRVLLWVEFILRRPRRFRVGWEGLRREIPALFRTMIHRKPTIEKRGRGATPPSP